MTAIAYTRFELVRTFRNFRLLFFSLGFPLILYFAIAGPGRHEHDFGGTGISLPLYYMVGLVAFGAMMALISTGARIAVERTDGWTRQLRVTPLSARAYLRAKILTGYAMALATIALLYLSGEALGVRLPVAWLCGITWHGGLYGAWIGMCIDMLLRGILVALRFWRGNWDRTHI